MIHQIDSQTTKVEFGKEGFASVGLYGTIGKLEIRELVTGKKIGDTITIEDTSELPKVIMEFSDVSSVDTMIAALRAIKHKMEYPYGTLPYAC